MVKDEVKVNKFLLNFKMFQEFLLCIESKLTIVKFVKFRKEVAGVLVYDRKKESVLVNK